MSISYIFVLILSEQGAPAVIIIQARRLPIDRGIDKDLI